MDKSVIGTNAGLVWRTMDGYEKKFWSYKELQEVTGLSDELLYVAIGWLARENKLEFDTDIQTGEDRIFLNVYYF